MAELNRTLGPWKLIAIGAAGVIGSSYLYLSSTFFDSFTFGGVVIGMIIATVLAACVAIGIGELASMFPRAGGEFVYSYVGFGRFPAFLVGWLLISTYTGIVGFYITATGRLLTSIAPKLESIPLYDIGGGTVHLPVLLIGLALVGGTLAINWYGAELSFGLQLLLFIVLMVIGAVLVVVAFWDGDYANTQPFFGELLPDEGLLSSAAFVIPALGFLTGFSVVAVMAEEADVSPKRLGTLIVISVGIAGLFYALIFYATGWLIPWQETAQMTNGTIEAFQVSGHPVLSWFALIAGFIGIVTTVIAVFAAASRLIFSLARVGMLPPALGRVHQKSGVPRNAVLLSAGMGLVVGSIGPDAIQWILNVGGLYVAAIWVITVLAFYVVRKKFPNLRRPYKIRGWAIIAPALGGVAGITLVLFTLVPVSPIAFTSIFEYGIVLFFVALGIVLYALAPKKSTRDQELQLLLGDHEVNSENDPAKAQG